MSKKIYEKNISELINTIDSVFSSKAYLPSLILIYSAIDIMAWLNRNKNHQYSDGSDFKAWVSTYLLPDSNLKCSSIDLWAARCSIVHTYTAVSRLSDTDKAKQLYYCIGTGKRETLQTFIDNNPKKRNKVIAESIDILLNALKVAIQKNNNILKRSSKLSKLVYKRANKFFDLVPDDYMDWKTQSAK